MTYTKLLFILLLSLCACGKKDTASTTAPVIIAEDLKPIVRSPKPETVTPSVCGYDVVARYPHQDTPFTQGLFIADGILYESSGKVGQSALIRHDIIGDTSRKVTALPADVFGEGAAAVGGKIISLTWRDGVGYVHSLKDFTPSGTFPVRGEGWGITYDGTRLIISDGTDRLRFLDPETYEETGSVAVRAGDRPLTKLNELEWIKGEIWANIWQTDVIVRIDPSTGKVIGFVDLSGLYADRQEPQDFVLNGIAYDPDADRLFVTGKRWPEIFEINLKGENCLL